MAISLKHDYADPHYRLGFIFQYRGLYDEAIGELNKFIEFASPEDKRLEKAKEMIEYIKDKNEKQTEKAAATKIIYPILTIGFPLIYLILIYLYTKNKKMSYISVILGSIAGVFPYTSASFSYVRFNKNLVHKPEKSIEDLIFTLY